MIKVFTSKDISELYKNLDEKTIKHITGAHNYVVPMKDNRYLMSFHSVGQIKSWIYAAADKCILVSDDSNITQCAEGIDADNGLTEMLDFFLTLTSKDVYNLEDIENRISDLEDDLLTKKPTKDGSDRIVKIRKEVLRVKRYYEQMEFLSDELAEANSNFSFVDKKFDRLLEFNMHLQEYVEQVREAYQSQIDIEQNNIMRFFTVVTTIFLPLTLITGWFGMNLIMPETQWKYGYLYAILMSIGVVVLMIAIFKKKKWL